MNEKNSQMEHHPLHWGTWNPDRPAELAHVEHGFALTPVLYSDRGGEASTIKSNHGFIFGERTLDGTRIHFATDHHETTQDWTYQLGSQDTGFHQAQLAWQTTAHGEWGLRFWVCICVSGPAACTFHYDPASQQLFGRVPGKNTALVVQSAKAPLMVTFHEDMMSLTNELHEHGYFYLGSRGTEGHFAVLRFNLEEGPAMQLNATLVAPSQIATSLSKPELPDTADFNSALTQQGTCDLIHQSVQAIHDVIAWNHVFDRINQRPYTVLTRNWNTQKFGGFGVWMNDVVYSGLLWSLFDTDKARQNIEAVLAWQTPEGNFPCLITGNDAWLDRSQPPIVSYCVWVIHQRLQDSGFLSHAFEHLIRNHDWWWRTRELNNQGLVAYGTSLDVGDGLYKGTKLAAKDESSMDNMPVHDPAPFNESTGMLESFDVGLNSLLALDAQVLAHIATAIGKDDEAARLTERFVQHTKNINEHLWDDQRNVYANRLLSGEFVTPLAPTSFYPLVTGEVPTDRREKLVTDYLQATDKFGGQYGLPSVTRDDPAYADNVYWRGRIWAPLNFWVYLGLSRSGAANAAQDLAKSGDDLFQQSWVNRQCGENYNADNGEIMDQADTDPFYSWGALLPYITVASVINETPWSGLVLTPNRVSSTMGPVLTSIGMLKIESHDDYWLVYRQHVAWLRGTVSGSIERISHKHGVLSLTLPTQTTTTWLELMSESIQSVFINGQELSLVDRKINLMADHSTRLIEVRFTDRE